MLTENDRTMPNAAVAGVFDLGGVLIDWDPGKVYHEAFSEDPDLVRRFLDTTLTDIGLASCETPGELADVVAPWRVRGGEFVPLIDFFADAWPRFVQGPMAESVSLVDRLLEREIPIYGLTNWPEATFPPRGDDFAFLDRFIDIVVSGREGMRKPGEQIFKLAIERFGLEPQATVYVDDHAGNIDTASRLGFRTHHFRSAAALEAFLEKQGLL